MKKLIETVVLGAVDFYGNLFSHVYDVYFQSSSVYWKLFVDYMVLPVPLEELLYVKLQLRPRLFTPLNEVFSNGLTLKFSSDVIQSHNLIGGGGGSRTRVFRAIGSNVYKHSRC